MTATEKARIAVIGGSGLYRMPGISDLREVRVDTPFGAPSDAVILGSLSGVRCAFLPRHGRGHALLPGEINFRANLWALKSLGAEIVVSFSAVGSLKQAFAPGHFVFPDQLVDETRGRVSSFFGEGAVAHVAFADPFCAGVRSVLKRTAGKLGIRAHAGGVLATMEGPAFSSRAESLTRRRLGYGLIGMTASPEAKLAREAELCYACAAMVTDYDCWKRGEEVSIDKVIATMDANSANAQRLIASAIAPLAALERGCPCPRALENAVLTRTEDIPARTFERLSLLIGRRVRP